LSGESDVERVGAIVLAGSAMAWAAGPEPSARARQAVRAALDAGLWPVVVVVDEGTDLVRGSLAGLPVVTCTGADDEYPGGALRVGLARLAECAPAAQALILLRCDGPSAHAGHLAALATAARREGKPIAASAQRGALCVPALFAAGLFPELARSGGRDARTLLDADAGRVVAVELQPSLTGQ
jgi:molybdenum cofactor cytidylyltransferase